MVDQAIGAALSGALLFGLIFLVQYVRRRFNMKGYAIPIVAAIVAVFLIVQIIDLFVFGPSGWF